MRSNTLLYTFDTENEIFINISKFVLTQLQIVNPNLFIERGSST